MSCFGLVYYDGAVISIADQKLCLIRQSENKVGGDRCEARRDAAVDDG